MLLRLAWFATLSGASAFLALPNARCYESVAAAARPATKKRATPALFQSTPAGPAPVILFHASYIPDSKTMFQLDVGGTLFTTTRATLCAASGSVLASTFMRGSSSAVHMEWSRGVSDAFIDSDPETFAWILGFLRRGCRLVGTPPAHLFEQVRADALSFGIDELVSALDERTGRAILNYETKAEP